MSLLLTFRCGNSLLSWLLAGGGYQSEDELEHGSAVGSHVGSGSPFLLRHHPSPRLWVTRGYGGQVANAFRPASPVAKAMDDKSDFALRAMVDMTTDKTAGQACLLTFTMIQSPLDSPIHRRLSCTRPPAWRGPCGKPSSHP